MILSFMVVWDLPTIRAGIASLKTSRLAPIYNEIAPSFGVFGALFGKALQAQVCPFQPVCIPNQRPHRPNSAQHQLCASQLLSRNSYAPFASTELRP